MPSHACAMLGGNSCLGTDILCAYSCHIKNVPIFSLLSYTCMLGAPWQLKGKVHDPLLVLWSMASCNVRFSPCHLLLVDCCGRSEGRCIISRWGYDQVNGRLQCPPPCQLCLVHRCGSSEGRYYMKSNVRLQCQPVSPAIFALISTVAAQSEDA